MTTSITSLSATQSALQVNGVNAVVFDNTGITSGAPIGFRNRIINGDMRIDQRNNGAAVTILTATNAYVVDRWRGVCSADSKFSLQQNAGAVAPPPGFTKYLGATSLSAYTPGSSDLFSIRQPIEGSNTNDLAWGTAAALAVTLSFWVRSSLTGTFGGSITNSDYTRSYPFSYQVPVANTWTKVAITIPGDAAGTWSTDASISSINVWLGLGAGATVSGPSGVWAGSAYRTASGAVSVVGTNAANFYVTGVQIELGSVATPFEQRPYGLELALCQRYYTELSTLFASGQSYGIGGAGGGLENTFPFPVAMRTTPTVATVGGSDGGTGGTFSITAPNEKMYRYAVYPASGSSAAWYVVSVTKFSAEL